MPATATTLVPDPTTWHDPNGAALFTWRRPDWWNSALCRGAGTEGWFATSGTPDEQGALVTCTSCPARAECLAYAVDNHLVGVWGGTTDRDRNRLKRERRRRA